MQKLGLERGKIVNGRFQLWIFEHAHAAHQTDISIRCTDLSKMMCKIRAPDEWGFVIQHYTQNVNSSEIDIFRCVRKKVFVNSSPTRYFPHWKEITSWKYDQNLHRNISEYSLPWNENYRFRLSRDIFVIKGMSAHLYSEN